MERHTGDSGELTECQQRQWPGSYQLGMKWAIGALVQWCRTTPQYGKVKSCGRQCRTQHSCPTVPGAWPSGCQRCRRCLQWTSRTLFWLNDLGSRLTKQVASDHNLQDALASAQQQSTQWWYCWQYVYNCYIGWRLFQSCVYSECLALSVSHLSTVPTSATPTWIYFLPSM